MRNFLFLTILCWCVVKVEAQTLDIGIGVGGSTYWGDMNTPDFGSNIGNTRPAVQLVGNLGFSDYLSVRGGLLYGRLGAADRKSNVPWQQTRNLDFTSPYLELSLLTEIHVFGYNRLEESFLSPYVALGLSGFYFNPSTVYQGVSYELQPLGTEGQGLPGFADPYSRFSGALVFGAGSKFKLSESVTMSVDILARRTFTDYIDDLSTDYVSYPELAAGNGEIAARLGNRMGEFLGQEEPVVLETGSQRGGNTVRDYVFTGMVTFYINFSQNAGGGLFKGRGGVECPTF